MTQRSYRFLHLLVATVLAFAGLSAQAQGQAQADYPLSSGDALRIQVFQNPDLTLETRISENGSITYPLIGAVELGGLPIAAAEQKIADALQNGGFIQKPQVNITLVQIRGSQVAVLGQVNRPGRFPLETTNTRLIDMLALAGGTSPGGDDLIVVTGSRNGRSFRKEVDLPALFMDDKNEGNIVLQGGDSIYVNRAPVFYIYGEAQRPGSFRIERNMTVMQALAQGGGPTARGTDKRLRLHRKAADGSIQITEPNLTDLVRPDDVIYVKESLF